MPPHLGGKWWQPFSSPRAGVAISEGSSFNCKPVLHAGMYGTILKYTANIRNVRAFWGVQTIAALRQSVEHVCKPLKLKQSACKDMPHGGQNCLQLFET